MSLELYQRVFLKMDQLQHNLKQGDIGADTNTIFRPGVGKDKYQYISL